MSADEEQMLMLRGVAPIPETMIDAQVAGWMKWCHIPRGEASKLPSDKEARTELERVIMRGLRGLVFTLGDSFCAQQEKGLPATPGARYVMTSQKRLLPFIGDAILYRMWPVEDREVFLAHAYGWYAGVATKAPEYFRRKEWELTLDEAGELVIALTGKREEVVSRPKRQRAKAFTFVRSLKK